MFHPTRDFNAFGSIWCTQGVHQLDQELRKRNLMFEIETETVQFFREYSMK